MVLIPDQLLKDLQAALGQADDGPRDPRSYWDKAVAYLGTPQNGLSPRTLGRFYDKTKQTPLVGEKHPRIYCAEEILAQPTIQVALTADSKAETWQMLTQYRQWHAQIHEARTQLATLPPCDLDKKLQEQLGKLGLFTSDDAKEREDFLALVRKPANSLTPAQREVLQIALGGLEQELQQQIDALPAERFLVLYRDQVQSLQSSLAEFVKRAKFDRTVNVLIGTGSDLEYGHSSGAWIGMNDNALSLDQRFKIDLEPKPKDGREHWRYSYTQHGDINLIIDDDFLAKHDYREVLAVLTHELGHAVLQHPEQTAKRKQAQHDAFPITSLTDRNARIAEIDRMTSPQSERLRVEQDQVMGMKRRNEFSADQFVVEMGLGNDLLSFICGLARESGVAHNETRMREDLMEDNTHHYHINLTQRVASILMLMDQQRAKQPLHIDPDAVLPSGLPHALPMLKESRERGKGCAIPE